MSALPVYYRAQKSAWMNGTLFKEWFIDSFVLGVKKYLKSKNLPPRAILLLDNSPSHPSESELQEGDIKAIFLPPDVNFNNATNGQGCN